jgi:hypothetical protein
MSIRQNLRILNKPISELAMLPQETIMSMAQSGQIPVAFVAPILAEKAEQAKASANAAAMSEQQQMPPGTVLESLIAQNAANEAQEDMPMMAQYQRLNMPMMGAQMPEDVGIGALPIPDEMIPGLAGGGIIAFQNRGLVEDIDESVLRTMTPEQILTYQNTGELPPGVRSMVAQKKKSTINPTFEAAIARAERGEGPNVSRPGTIDRVPQGLTPSTPEDRLAFDQSGQTPPGVAFPFQEEKGEVSPVVSPQSTPPPRAGIDSLISQADKLARLVVPQTLVEVPTIKQASGQTDELLRESGFDPDMFSKMKQDIGKQREGLKDNKSEAINMRLIEAGLAIMGGASPNAFENIGKGATGAVKGLTEDFKDLRKAEREFKSAEQSLAMKQNEAALGKAGMTQTKIDKAQLEKAKRAENFASARTSFLTALMRSDDSKAIVAAQMSGAFERTFQIELNNLAAQGKDPKDPKIIKQARDAAYSSAGSTQLAGQMATDYRKAAEIVSKKLNKLASSESRELRRITKEEGPEAGERYKDTLIEAEAARIRRGEGSRVPGPAAGGASSSGKVIDFGIIK